VLRVADVLSEVRDADEFGIKINAEPEVDYPAVMARREKVISTLTGGVAGLMKKNSIEVVEGEASLAGGGQVAVGGETYGAKNIILATGSAWKPLGVPGEQELLGHGVSSCATCDGFFFRNQHIIVVGGGDTAMEEATFLTRFAETVTIVHRRDSFRASKVMQLRALSNPKITVEWNSVVEEVLGEDGKVVGARLRNLATGETKVLDVTGVFVAIGHDPRSALVRGQIELDEAGYVQVASPSTSTKIPGVFACGDLVDHTYRQAITAAGSGCAAAIDAERWLAEGPVPSELAGGGYGQASQQVAAVTGEADMGGTMRLGAYPARLVPGSVVAAAYGETMVSERHRHRYEVNNDYRSELEKAGLVVSGESKK